MSVIHQQFASAPTVRKGYLRLFCSIFVNISSMIWLQADISKAFLQSDYLHTRDKVVALPPEYIGSTGLSWEGWVAANRKLSCFARDHPSESTTTESFREHLELFPDKIGMLTNRPLYGSTDAPLRWYITIARALKKAGYEVMNSDRCVFTKHVNAKSSTHSFAMHGKMVEAVILIHVDDIIYVGRPRERANFESRINFFLRGDIEELRIGTPLAFCGIEANLFEDRHITLSQLGFYRQIPELHLNHFVQDNKILLSEKFFKSV